MRQSAGEIKIKSLAENAKMKVKLERCCIRARVGGMTEPHHDKAGSSDCLGMQQYIQDPRFAIDSRHAVKDTFPTIANKRCSSGETARRLGRGEGEIANRVDARGMSEATIQSRRTWPEMI